MNTVKIKVKIVVEKTLEIPGSNTNNPKACVLRSDFRECDVIECKDCIAMGSNWKAFKEQN
jgi:hypothetical protein